MGERAWERAPGSRELRERADVKLSLPPAWIPHRAGPPS